MVGSPRIVGDLDGDDCDDRTAAVGPTVVEACNGVDDDCDGLVDEGVISTRYDDADGDGHGAASSTTCPDDSGGGDSGGGAADSEEKAASDGCGCGVVRPIAGAWWAVGTLGIARRRR